MNDQSGTAQLRFLEETAIRLRQNGFTVEPIEDHHLPVCWEKGRLCRITGKGSVLYRQENVDSIRAQDALQVVIDTAKMTSEYMAILEYAPQLKATDLTGDYRILADFGDAVLAGHPTERGVQFVTWEWDFDRKGVHHGHYFQGDYEAAKRNFTVRSGLVPKDALFEPEQLAEIYRALRFVREQDESLNLTFCCQQATVITDFSDLAAIGRDHYMNLHGGSASVDELNALDGKGTARQLIDSGSGTITPYGVVYDNGMKLEQVYDGRFFPCYYYEPNVITVAVTSKNEPEDTEHITWLFLPMVQEEIDRALFRGGITDPADVRLRLEDSQLPNEVDVLLDMEYETLSDLNELAEATDGLSKADMEKLGAVVMLAEPKSAAQIKNLAESLDLFDFAPGAHTPQEYGKYMIQQSGRFEYDENLDAFYDYEKYGTERMNEEDGMFTDRGYIAYKGYISMEEVMNGGQSNRMVMGGLSQ